MQLCGSDNCQKYKLDLLSIGVLVCRNIYILMFTAVKMTWHKVLHMILEQAMWSNFYFESRKSVEVLIILKKWG